MTDIDKRVEEIRALPRPWCGDSSCRFGRPENAGMMTNGGCRCFREKCLKPTERAAVQLANAVPDLLDIVASFRQELEAVTAERDEAVAERDDARAEIWDQHFADADGPMCWDWDDDEETVPVLAVETTDGKTWKTAACKHCEAYFKSGAWRHHPDQEGGE